MKKEITELRVEHEIEFKLNTPFPTKEKSIKYIYIFSSRRVFRSREKESTNIGRIVCALWNILPNFPRETIAIVLRT